MKLMFILMIILLKDGWKVQNESETFTGISLITSTSVIQNSWCCFPFKLYTFTQRNILYTYIYIYFKKREQVCIWRRQVCLWVFMKSNPKTLHHMTWRFTSSLAPLVSGYIFISYSWFCILPVLTLWICSETDDWKRILHHTSILKTVWWLKWDYFVSSYDW